MVLAHAHRRRHRVRHTRPAVTDPHRHRLRVDHRPVVRDRHHRRPAHDSGVASAMVNTSQQVGGSIGTALLSTLAASRRYRIPRRTTRPVPPHSAKRPCRDIPPRSGGPPPSSPSARWCAEPFCTPVPTARRSILRPNLPSRISRTATNSDAPAPRAGYPALGRSSCARSTPGMRLPSGSQSLGANGTSDLAVCERSRDAEPLTVAMRDWEQCRRTAVEDFLTMAVCLHDGRSRQAPKFLH